MKKGLKPIIDENTEILILGSCPGDNSILNQKYYNSPNNQFWKLIGDILNVDLKNKDYSEKIKILLENKVGLWDVMHSCEREGSLDSNIIDFKPNDFSELNLPKLKKILFNGKKAFELKDKVNLDVEKKLLSSSSGANSIPYEDKLRLWCNLFSKSDESQNFNIISVPDSKDKSDINKEIQRILIEKEIYEAKAVDVAYWLDQEGILKDSKDRPGKPLRDLLRKGQISNAVQREGRFWFIMRED